MPGGSLYDYLHKNHNVLKLPQLLKFAIDVSRGMEYLHQNNIIHRDLKTANLLMDIHKVRIFIIIDRVQITCLLAPKLYKHEVLLINLIYHFVTFAVWKFGNMIELKQIGQIYDIK